MVGTHGRIKSDQLHSNFASDSHREWSQSSSKTSTLKAKIPFFQDLFDLGQPGNNRDKIPSVRLPDDEQAFTLFLRGVYGYDLTPYLPTLSPRNTPLLSELLSIADKYGYADAHRLVVPLLARDWPGTLAGWDAVEQEIHSMFIKIREVRINGPLPEADDASDEPTLDARLPDPALVIALAVQHRNHLGLDLGLGPNLLVNRPYPEFLHSAFYHLSRLPPYADPEEDSCLINEDDHDDGVRTARRSLLGRQDLQLLLRGVDALRVQAAATALKEFPVEVRKKRKGSTEEMDALLTWWTQIGVNRLLGEDYQRDILRSLNVLALALDKASVEDAASELKAHRAGDRSADIDQSVSDAWEKLIDEETAVLYEKTSEAYRKQLSSWLREERVSIWDSLPRFFGLARFYDIRLG